MYVYLTGCYSPTAMRRHMLWQEKKPTMPPVDAAALQQTRYDRQRMNVISRAMDKVVNIVSCFPSNSNIAVSSGVSTVLVVIHNGE